MESEYARLADLIRTRAQSHAKRKFLVAIAGPPGSGKTTIAREVVQRLNSPSSPSAMHVNGNSSETAQSASPAAVLISMDGFHLPRSTLDQLPNREEAYVRRGAPWTFDVDRFVAFMSELRAWADRNQRQQNDAADGEGDERTYIYAPSFDHQLKDPVENGLRIPASASILIIEGNYLLLDEPQWRDIADLVDYRVFVDADAHETRERVAKRHVQAGIEKTIEDAYRRVDRNDALNGMLIRAKLIRPDLVVRSVDDMAG